MGFNTILFAMNDYELANKIENLPIGFDGMENVKISWIDAKALLKDGSSYWKNLYLFVDMCSNVGKIYRIIVFYKKWQPKQAILGVL